MKTYAKFSEDKKPTFLKMKCNESHAYDRFQLKNRFRNVKLKV